MRSARCFHSSYCFIVWVYSKLLTRYLRIEWRLRTYVRRIPHGTRPLLLKKKQRTWATTYLVIFPKKGQVGILNNHFIGYGWYGTLRLIRQQLPRPKLLQSDYEITLLYGTTTTTVHHVAVSTHDGHDSNAKTTITTTAVVLLHIHRGGG